MYESTFHNLNGKNGGDGAIRGLGMHLLLSVIFIVQSLVSRLEREREGSVSCCWLVRSGHLGDDWAMWRELRVCCFENNSYTNCRQDPNIYDLACTQEAVAASIHQTEFVNRWSNGDNWRSWVHFLWVVLYLILESGVGRFITGIEGKQ